MGRTVINRFLILLLLTSAGCSHYRTDHYEEFAQAAELQFEKNDYVETLALLEQIESQDLLSSPLGLMQCESLEKMNAMAKAKNCYLKGKKLYITLSPMMKTSMGPW